MLIEGKHICRYCNEAFEWFYLVPQKYNSSRLMDVETIPNNKVGIYYVIKSVEKDGYILPLKATIYCPKCGKLDELEIKYDDK